MENRLLKWIARAAAVLVALTIGGSHVQAQELPTTPSAGKRVAFDGAPNELDQLSVTYLAGDWQEFAKQAQAILARVADDNATPIFTLKSDYVHLLWVGQVPTAADPTVFSAVMHEPAGEPYSRTLPGVSRHGSPKLVEVFISVNKDASIDTYYISKPLPDPLLAQVPDVVDKFVGPLFTLLQNASPIAGVRSVLRTAEAAPAARLMAVVRNVPLPEARAGVEGSVNATLPLTPEDYDKEVDALAARLRDEGIAPPALEQAAAAIIQALRRAPTLPACVPPATARECHASMNRAITEVIGPLRERASTPRELETLDRLDAAAREFVAGVKPDVVKGTFTLDNSPLTHLGFGIASSFAPSVFGGDQRAVVDSNKISAAALPRALQMVVLNWSPWGFQEKTARRFNARGLVRPFVGAVFSPDIGVSAGVALMILSNLGVNVGYAQVFITKPADGLDIGADLSEKLTAAAGQPTDQFKYSEQQRHDPLQTGHLGALFLGVSYNFK